MKKADLQGIVTKRGKDIIATFEYKNFIYQEYFVAIIKDKLEVDKIYYVLIKVKFEGVIYKMAGKQFNFDTDKCVKENLSKLYQTITTRLEHLLEEFKFKSNDMI